MSNNNEIEDKFYEENKDSNKCLVFIRYNPYISEIKITINKKNLARNSELNIGKCSFEDWINKIPANLFKEYPYYKNFKIGFQGSSSDYNNLKELIEKSKIDTKKINIEFCYYPIQTLDFQKKENILSVTTQAKTKTTWTCSCGTVNTDNFCGHCGKQKDSKNLQNQIKVIKPVQEPIQQKQTPIIKQVKTRRKIQKKYVEVTLDNNVFKQLGYDIVDIMYKHLKKNGKYITYFNIPSTYNYNGKNYKITSIDESAFARCKSLTSITIPNSVTSIGESAFAWCESLTSITIPDSVTSIGESAFAQCESLTSITIPNSVISIGESSFAWCESLTSITIPERVTSIGEKVFYSCKSLTSITIPDKVTFIGKEAFAICTSLTSITIPDKVTFIGESAFYYCSSLKSVTIPDSVTSIGEFAFYYCSSLKSVTIPDSVTSIGESAFYNVPHIEYHGRVTDRTLFLFNNKWGAKSMN